MAHVFAQTHSVTDKVTAKSRILSAAGRGDSFGGGRFGSMYSCRRACVRPGVMLARCGGAIRKYRCSPIVSVFSKHFFYFRRL